VLGPYDHGLVSSTSVMVDEEKVFLTLTTCQRAIRKLAHPYRVAVIIALEKNQQLSEPEIKRGKKPVFRGCLGLARSKEEAPSILHTCRTALGSISKHHEQVLAGLRTLFLAPPEFFIDDELDGLYDSGWDS
jgi:hypothetical protein